MLVVVLPSSLPILAAAALISTSSAAGITNAAGYSQPPTRTVAPPPSPALPFYAEPIHHVHHLHIPVVLSRSSVVVDLPGWATGPRGYPASPAPPADELNPRSASSPAPMGSRGTDTPVPPPSAAPAPYGFETQYPVPPRLPSSPRPAAMGSSTRSPPVSIVLRKREPSPRVPPPSSALIPDDIIGEAFTRTWDDQRVVMPGITFHPTRHPTARVSAAMGCGSPRRVLLNNLLSEPAGPPSPPPVPAGTVRWFTVDPSARAQAPPASPPPAPIEYLLAHLQQPVKRAPVTLKRSASTQGTRKVSSWAVPPVDTMCMGPAGMLLMSGGGKSS